MYNSSNEMYWTTVDMNFDNCTSIESCTDNSIQECYKKEVCNNKLNSEKLVKLKTSNSSSGGRFIDSSYVYNQLLLTTFNLGMGILIVSSFIIEYF
jgi:hypothetical protein